MRTSQYLPRIALIVWLVTLGGCMALEPMAEPEVEDLQVTIDGLKTVIREAQRTLGELRGELEARRKELAEAQVARAQFEGKLREAERRLAEARHVVELQREELGASRTERERLSQSSRQLQGQLKQLQKQLAQHSKLLQNKGEVAPAAAPARGGKPPVTPVRVEKAALPIPTISSTPAVPRPSAPSAENGSQSAAEQSDMPPPTLVVKVGDTLWSLAQKHGVDLAELRALNNLSGDRILPGQALWLPEF
ncbi:MAG: LysM peptidoglycan-binding domain-containing protein [Nitrospiraceae bacterium]